MKNNIYRIIKNRILCLEYAPGVILNEKVLANEFGVSRTPLREVLNKLEYDQLVRVLPRTGTMVLEIEYQLIMNTYQVRLGIEEMIGKLAADNISEKHIQQLLELKERSKELFTNKDKVALLKIDRDLRAVLNNAANNPVLKNISEFLYDLTVRLWCTVLHSGDWQEEVQSIVDEIEQTIDTLNSQEKKLGVLRCKILNQHVERITRKFLAAPI